MTPTDALVPFDTIRERYGISHGRPRAPIRGSQTIEGDLE